ncbi:hypothetical protein Tco_1427007, partial [Tanacetum coccineum]
MAHQVILAAQLVPRFHTIGRCNNYAMLQSIPCSPECKIVGKILLDHPLSYALTATVDVPTFIYTVNMFRDILHFPVETPENPFVAPVNIETIEAFMNGVGYQGVVDKVSTFYTKNLAQPWQTMFKEAIQYPRFIKLIIADLMKKFPDIPQRIEEDYHSIKDDIPLVSVYTTGNVLVRGMLIPDAFLTEEIRATDDFKEYEKVEKEEAECWRIKFTTEIIKITIRQQKVVEGDKDDDSENRPEPGSHKENPEHIDDDDDNKDEDKVDEDEGGKMGSLETRTEKMQTSIPTPP